jgi:CDP-glycerol glycerophosphotransferase (TagB/SpsB family)
VRKDQINVFLQHYGMGYKQVAHLYNSPDYVDYVLTTNEFVCGLEKKSITYSETSHFIYGELPRNDVLKQKWDELSKITRISFNKVVMWAPTLRESRYYNRVDSDISYPFGISLIYEKKDMNLLNDQLIKLDMMLLIKIHPRQKINFKEDKYSNILYLDGTSIKKIHAYKLLSQMDALITDYSSIVFDYMLLDRPCAWVLEDREHYKIEYLMDNPEEYMPGERIYTLEDLKRFLVSVSDGIDTYGDERRNICRRCNPSFEGKGSESLMEVLGL